MPAKNGIFEPFIDRNDHFAKTGSGQTSGKLKKREDVFRTTQLRDHWGVQQVLRENGTFFEFFLCSSRACLGKIMHFIYKWLKKCRFLATCVTVAATVT
jgi:hypothetical protein